MTLEGGFGAHSGGISVLGGGMNPDFDGSYDFQMYEIAKIVSADPKDPTNAMMDWARWEMSGPVGANWAFGWINHSGELDAIRNGNRMILDIGRASIDLPLKGTAAGIYQGAGVLAKARQAGVKMPTTSSKWRDEMTIQKLFLGALIIVSAIFAQSASAQAAAQIEFYDVQPHGIINVGTVHHNMEYSVRIKNSGDEPLFVHMIKASPSAVKILGAPAQQGIWMMVEPGRDEFIRFTIDPRAGTMPFRGQIMIWTSDPRTPRANVGIEGQIVP